MRVTRHPYEIDGWGVGELWIGDGAVVVAHDPPVPGVSFAGAVPAKPPRGATGAPRTTLSRKSSPDSDAFVPDLLQRLHSYFAGEQVSFAEVPLDEDWATPFQAA